MQTNRFLRQFVKDGLIGLAVVFLVFAILLVVSLSFKFTSSSYDFWWLIKELFVFPITSISIANFHRTVHVFFSPMPLIILITFLVIGSSGQSFENINSRTSWVKPLLIVILKSWLLGIILWPVLLIVIVQLWVGSNDSLRFSVNIPSLYGTIGAIIGLLIGCLASFFLNPSKRILRTYPKINNVVARRVLFPTKQSPKSSVLPD